MNPTQSLIDRLQAGETILLDGGMGSELERRGVSTSLPLWSAEALMRAPDVVRQIHLDFAEAGADILTTNTFRTTRRTLAKAGQEDRTQELNQLAVKLAQEARQACGRDQVVVAGSIAPLEDCYEPDLVPDDAALAVEHREQAQFLADAGADLIFVETMNTLREAQAALAAAQETGLPRLISFVCNPQGELLSGESLDVVLEGIKAYEPFAVLTNCRPLDAISPSLDALLAADGDLPVGIYANGDGQVDDDAGWKTGEASLENYCQQAEAWLKKGARLIGGCCGTSPEYIKQLSMMMSMIRPPR